jgi:hypothetical protein
VSSAGSDGRFETFDANEHYVVVRDDEGYGVWRMEDLEEGDPVARFRDTDDGYEAAVDTWRVLTRRQRQERGVWLDRLRNTVLVALAVWVLTSAIPIVLMLFDEDSNGFFGGDPGEPLFERILYVASSIAFDFWIGAAIAYVIVWMDRRRTGAVSAGTDPG